MLCCRVISPCELRRRLRLLVLRTLQMTSQHARQASSSSTPSQGLTLDPRPLPSHLHRLSAAAPPDAPPLNIRYPPLGLSSNVAYVSSWFYATDVPKKRLVPEASEKPKAPAKWSAFAGRDSKALEAAFQRLMADPQENVAPILVNEDHLFEVDVGARELKPVYFRGSTYEVRPAAAWLLMGARYDAEYGSFKRDPC